MLLLMIASVGREEGTKKGEAQARHFVSVERISARPPPSAAGESASQSAGCFVAGHPQRMDAY